MDSRDLFEMYAKKAQVVDRMSEIYEMLGDCKCIKYHRDHESGRETVTIEYENGHADSINVTCDSYESIIKEIVKQLGGETALGLCRRY